MKHLLLILFLIAFVNLYTQGWTNISPFPASNLSVRGNFISEEEGWIFQLGMYISRDIYHTEDGGESWEIIYSLEDSLEYFVSLQMINSEHGWATIQFEDEQNPDIIHEKYLKTTDGGYDWEDMTEFLPDVTHIRPIYFINHEIGFIDAGFDDTNHTPLVYKTIDGGYNWYLVNIPVVYDPYPPDWVSYSITCFYFLTENHGWASCSALIDFGLSLYTVDGGENWEVGIEPGPPDIYDIKFSTYEYGGAVGRNAIYSFVYITEDNFQSILYNHQSWVVEMGQYAQAICFQNESTIWVTGCPGIIYRSMNGGESFQEFQIVNADLYQIQFFNNTGFIFGTNNSLLKFVNHAGINNHELPIANYELSNYPNPFNPNTEIRFQTSDFSELETVEISIYNLKGQKIKTYHINPSTDQPINSVTWNGTDQNNKPVSSGIYFYKFKSGDVEVSRKMLLLK